MEYKLMLCPFEKENPPDALGRELAEEGEKLS